MPNKPRWVKPVNLKKSAGILDDYAVRKNVATKEGTIEHVPTDDNHLVNKKYVDDQIAAVPTDYLKLDCSNDPLTGDLDFNGNNIEHVAKINKDCESDLNLFGNLDLTYGSQDGKGVYIWRKDAGGDCYYRLYVNKWREAKIEVNNAPLTFVASKTNTNMYFYTGDGTANTGAVNLCYYPYCDLKYFSNITGDTNRTIYHYGWINGAKKYVSWKLNSTGDTFDLDRQDSNITSFNINFSTKVTGDLTVTGELKGGRDTFIFTKNEKTAASTDGYMNLPGNIAGTATMGVPMNRAGSIVGARCIYNIATYTNPGNLLVDVYVNGASVYSVTNNISGAGIGQNGGTQARGTDTFGQGDLLTGYVDFSTGTFTAKEIILVVEVQYDT